MKLFTIVLATTAAFGIAEAQNIRVGCRPDPDSDHAGTTMNDVKTFLLNPELRGRTVPDLKYGFWDGKVQKCCDSRFKGDCSDVFTFEYNHPFNWANYQFQAPPNHKWIQCFEVGGDLSCK